MTKDIDNKLTSFERVINFRLSYIMSIFLDTTVFSISNLCRMELMFGVAQ